MKKRKSKVVKHCHQHPPVDWALVQRVVTGGSVVSGHLALQLVGKHAPVSDILLAQLIVEISNLREVIASK